MADGAPKVFMSYTLDSPEHAERVLTLANRLRGDGVDCVLDQYETSPSEGWPRWMDRQLRDADAVLVVCNRSYYLRVMGEETPGVGLGVRWEGNLIYQYLYDAGADNSRFIPVLLGTAEPADIPTPLRNASATAPTPTKAIRLFAADCWHRLQPKGLRWVRCRLAGVCTTSWPSP